MKLKFGAIVVDGSGKIGGHVVSKNRGGKYLRTKVTPTNPNTPAQASARALLSSLSTQWAELDPAERLSFNNAVASFATTDIFGDIKNPSGFNLFVKLNANLSITGQAAITAAPEKIEVPFAPLLSAEGLVATQALSLAFDGAGLDGTIVLVSATPALSQGVSNANSKFRAIGFGTVTTGGLSVGTMYTDKFGAFTAGQNFQFKVEPVVATGQKGTGQTVKAAVV